jgi:hypothetical protein
VLKKRLLFLVDGVVVFILGRHRERLIKLLGCYQRTLA